MKHIVLFLLIIVLPIMVCKGQSKFNCNGVIIDGVTQKRLQDVRIYIDGDTNLVARSNINGEFKISVKVGTKVNFRKIGLTWHSIEILSKDSLKVKLFQSKSRNFKFQEIIVDNIKISKMEWSDINMENITNATVNEIDGKLILMIFTK